MDHSLRTGITAEMLPGPLRIHLDGCLTEETLNDLLPILKRGATFPRCPDLVVDLTRVDHLEAGALETVGRFIARHNAAHKAAGLTARVSIHHPEPDPSSDGQAARCGAVVPFQNLEGVQRQPHSGDRAANSAALPVVADLMSPLGQTIGITQSLQAAAERITEDDPGLAVMGLNNTAIGFITAEDLFDVMDTDPMGWRRKRCSALARVCETPIQPHHSIDGVIHLYRHEGIRPLLVLDEERPVGLLHPTTLRQWYQDRGSPHWPETLDRPAVKTAAAETSPQALSEPAGDMA